MALFCPKCNATLIYPLSGESVQTCAVCGERVVNESARPAGEPSRDEFRSQLDEFDAQFARYARQALPAPLLARVDEFQFYLGQHSMPRPTRDQIVSIATQLFADNAASVLEMLDQVGDVPEPSQRERVQLAVLRLSKGELSRIAPILERAKLDYRDVLADAELPNALALGLSNVVRMDSSKRVQVAEYDLLQYVEWIDSNSCG